MVTILDADNMLGQQELEFCLDAEICSLLNAI